MLKVSVIGLGNAGNQVAELAKKTKNIPGLAINSSSKDISTLTAVDKMVVGDEKGAGKDRSIAKDFMRKNIENLVKKENVKSLIEGSDVVFIVSSTGGGTGSGQSPVFCNILSKLFPSIKFILVNVFPPLKESVAAQQNTIEYLKEMVSFDPTYMSYDNNRFASLPVKEMMEKVNEEIVEDICIIRGDYQYNTPYNSIDEKDMLKIVSTPGRLVIAKAYGFKEKDLDETTIEDLLIDQIKSKSAMVEIEKDGIVKRMGVISNLPEKMTSKFDNNIQKLKEYTGEPIEGFEHVYVNQKEELNKVLVLMSGLSIPDDRIEKINDRVEEAKEKISRVKESSLLESTDVSFLGELRNTSTEEVDTQIDIGAIFDQFGL